LFKPAEDYVYRAPPQTYYPIKLDMRLTENRIRGLNMDGSLDMRFKENRIRGFNKDGTLDRRFKCNR
jgi:hypothetical protein